MKKHEKEILPTPYRNGKPCRFICGHCSNVVPILGTISMSSDAHKCESPEFIVNVEDKMTKVVLDIHAHSSNGAQHDLGDIECVACRKRFNSAFSVKVGDIVIAVFL